MKILFYFIWVYNKYIFIFYNDEFLKKKKCNNQMFNKVQKFDKIFE